MPFLNYVAIKDLRTGKIYIEHEGAFLRTFEEEIDMARTVSELLKKYPDAIELSEGY